MIEHVDFCGIDFCSKCLEEEEKKKTHRNATVQRYEDPDYNFLVRTVFEI